MDPISIIVTALATGAAAGLKPTAEKAIKDAYAGIKGLIQRKYGRVNVDMLETEPASKSRQGVVKEDLEKTGAGADEEVLQKAKVLLESIQNHAPEAAGDVGLSLEDIKGNLLRLGDIMASGNVQVRVKQAEMSGDIEITGIRAGLGKDSPNP